jgi:hypothetical protein
MAAHFWTCQKQAKGVKCGHVNPKRKHLCEACGKRRPASKRPAHMAVLNEWPYERCVEVFGEQCGICGAEPTEGRRLDRDHVHRGDGFVRGLLCWHCNMLLHKHVDLEWLEKAVAYLQRAHDRQTQSVG